MKTKKKLFEKIINIVLTIAIVICCFFIGFKLTFISVVVSGDSMNPTIEDGAKGYMVKVNENSKIERFDVVACIYNNSTNNYIIKRVLGLPNETIELKDNQLYVNNEIIQQDFSFISQDIDFALSTSLNLSAKSIANWESISSLNALSNEVSNKFISIIITYPLNFF